LAPAAHACMYLYNHNHLFPSPCPSSTYVFHFLCSLRDLYVYMMKLEFSALFMPCALRHIQLGFHCLILNRSVDDETYI
jgi:hypothetical protein